jgi:hypothetical protein
MTDFELTHSFLPFALSQAMFPLLVSLWNRMAVRDLDAHASP